MDKVLTSKEISDKVYNKYVFEELESKLTILNSEYNRDQSLLNMGINPKTLRKISEKEKLDISPFLKKEYIKKKDILESLKIDAACGLMQEKETNIKKEKKETIIPSIKERNNKRKIIFKNFLITSLTGLNIGLVAFGYNFTKKLQNESALNGITKEYNNDINNAVSESYHYKFQNSDVNGETITFVSDEEKSSYPVEYLNHEIIANTIETSNNPDLALFTLYKDFGTSNIPAYNEITSKTCEELDFIYNGEQIKCDFNEYLRLNGFNNKDEYYESCKEELLKGPDTKLDNLKVYVKKMTE